MSESWRSRSAESVQQRQPLVMGMSSPSTCDRPPLAMSDASTLISPMSFTSTAARTPLSLARMWLSSVVLPAPR